MPIPILNCALCGETYYKGQRHECEGRTVTLSGTFTPGEGWSGWLAGALEPIK